MAGGTTGSRGPWTAEAVAERTALVMMGRAALERAEPGPTQAALLQSLRVVKHALSDVEAMADPAWRDRVRDMLMQTLHGVFKVVLLSEGMEAAPGDDDVLVLPTSVSQDAGMNFQILVLKPPVDAAGIFAGAIQAELDQIRALLQAREMFDVALFHGLDALRRKGSLDAKVAEMHELFGLRPARIKYDSEAVHAVERLLRHENGGSPRADRTTLHLTPAQWALVQESGRLFAMMLADGVTNVEVMPAPRSVAASPERRSVVSVLFDAVLAAAGEAVATGRTGPQCRSRSSEGSRTPSPGDSE